MNLTTAPYEPPLTEGINSDARSWGIGREPDLYDGVLGLAYRDGDKIRIPLIIAEREGSGKVGEFLDRLTPRCVIVCVTSERLEGMLKRRGFKRSDVLINGMIMDEWSKSAARKGE